MSSELERTQRALKAAQSYLNALVENGPVHQWARDVLKEIDAILHPPTEWEDVPVTRWAVMQDTCAEAFTHEATVAGEWKRAGLTVVELTGTLHRPKSQPVERSVTGTVFWTNSAGFIYPAGEDIDWTCIAGKTGIFTFSWTE